MTKKFSALLFAVMALSILIPSYGQNVINCSSGFTSSGTCGVGTAGSGVSWPIFGSGGTSAGLSGSAINLQPTGSVHAPNNVNYQTPVNVQAFAATFRFVPNAWNLAFVLQNATHNGGAGPMPGYALAQSFTSGAGCEGGFYQAFGTLHLRTTSLR